MKKNSGTKIMALLALFGIIISIIGTGVLIIYDLYSTKNTTIQQKLSPEQLDELMKTYSGSLNSTGEVNIGTGKINIGTGNIKSN